MSTAEPTTFTPDEPSSSGTRMGVPIAIGAVMALIIGGGAFAVAQVMGGGGDRPASAMPADTAAYLQIDIDPAAGQKIAALDFLSGIETEEMEALRDGDLKREIFDLLTEEDEGLLNALDYEEDVEPWLGDRVGVGVLDDGESAEPTVLVAVQVKDEDAAQSALERIEQDEAAWFFHSDYVVITTAEQVKAAESGLEGGNLAEQDYFVEDLEALGDQGLMSGWVDLAAMSQLSQQAMESDLGEMGSTMDNLYLGSDFGSLSEGRAAMTLRFGDDGIELAANTRDTPLQGLEISDTAHLVGDLPEDTVAVFSLEHGDQIVDLLWEQVSAIAPEEVASAQEEAAAEGFELPADLKVLVGDSMTLSAGAGVVDAIDRGADQAPLGYRAHTDTERAEALMEMILSAEGMEGGQDVVQYRSDDGVLSIAASQEYVDELAESDGLGGSDLFDRAVPDADEAQSVMYVDLNAFEELYLSEVDGDDRDALEKLAAVGVSTTLDEDGNGSFLLKVVTD
ncbi:MAG: DUF3352 domain-containing protein [Ornithinimicrobium sp.]|uniref:DUF3352 domain-containing protein n=1 Tax=Ornithinimicrobium sp. TaxID=1977084 RepID=UPI003D9B6439